MLKEFICYECGKTFIPAPYHKFKKEGKRFCKWTCYNSYLKRQEQEKEEKKREEQKDKL